MSCTRPIPAYKVAYHDPDTGFIKYKIRFINHFQYSEDRMKEAFGDNLLFLPCGHCDSCKMAYRKDWSIRCEMESLFHEDNCFVTLTLDDAHVKPVPVKEDVQYFLHKLRDSYGIKCRYFACGELGSHTGRAHYHLILFGYKPADLKYYGQSKSGESIYTSKFLSKVWNQGQVIIGEFSVRTASYVAGYVGKDKNQAFLMESRRPGLGYIYMTANFRTLFKYGHYQGKNGQVHRLPRYFKKICEQLGYDPIHIQLDKEEVMTEINTSEKFSHGFTHDAQLDLLHESIMKDKLTRLKRGM